MLPPLSVALGPLASVVDDTVRDLCVLGDGVVWRRRSGGFEQTDLIVDPREARRIGVGLVEAGGGRVDDARPLGDAALAGSVRVHVALPPAVRSGAVISLRFPHANSVAVSDYDTPRDWSWYEFTSQSILVTGPTGSGKTTLLERLIGQCPRDERIVVIEDIPEIVGVHPHVVHLTTRAPTAEGAGELTMTSLVRETLRMSPDRIVLGEVRGPEIVDLLMALTAGHNGLSSLHARSLAEVPNRLTALGMVAGIGADTLARIVPIAFDAVIHCEKQDGRVRLSAGRFTVVDDELTVTQ